jgi:hypothetical protein
MRAKCQNIGGHNTGWIRMNEVDRGCNAAVGVISKKNSKRVEEASCPCSARLPYFSKKVLLTVEYPNALAIPCGLMD